jgi:hypothetical protein
MFVCTNPPVTPNSPVFNLIYQLIFFGLKNINFSQISYFSLVFSAQMIALEFYNAMQNVTQMIEFFLYKFLNFYILESLNLNFETLFELHKTVQPK